MYQEPVAHPDAGALVGPASANLGDDRPVWLGWTFEGRGSMDRDKRELRQQKREIKQKGNQRARRVLKRVLAEDPEDAPFVEPDYGRYRSAELNGIDRDATRRARGEAGA